MPESIQVKCRKSRLPARRLRQKHSTHKCARAVERLANGECKFIEVVSGGDDTALASARSSMFLYAKRLGVDIQTYISERGTLIVHLVRAEGAGDER